MMVEPWPVKYIGLPWIAGEHDCWGFARRVWRDELGLDVEVVDVDAASALSVMREIRDGDQLCKWERIEKPEEWCGVLMGKSERPSHVGVWSGVDGGKILHSVHGAGVIFTNETGLALMGYRVLGFYRRKR